MTHDVSAAGSGPAVCMIGAGQVCQNEGVPLAERVGAFELMKRAVALACRDSGAPLTAADITWIGIPEGTWVEPDPGRRLAGLLGVSAVTSVRADVGVTQDELLAHACKAVAEGSTQLALVVGGEARFTTRMQQAAGFFESEPVLLDGVPDLLLQPSTLGIDDLELIRDVVTPAISFAIIESALRHQRGDSVAVHDEHLAEVQAVLAETSKDARATWSPRATNPDEVLASRMVADPYRSAMCSNWNVDLASAVLLCSAEFADTLNIDVSRRLFVERTAWSNHSVAVPARRDLTRSVGAEAVAAVIAPIDSQTSPTPSESDGLTSERAYELYSCFPASLRLWAAALERAGVDPGTVDQWTTTGGMAAAGGPLNNSGIQGWHALWRRHASSKAMDYTAVATTVSGSFTKQGGTRFTGFRPEGWMGIDLTEDVARAEGPGLPIDPHLAGPVQIVGHTIDRRIGRAIAIVEHAGIRSIAMTSDPVKLARFGTEDLVGARIKIDRDGEILRL